MSARDKIRGKVREDAAGFRSELVTVPEWDDEQVLVREASAADRREWQARSRKFVEVAGGFEVVPVDDVLADIYLVARCTFEADGSARVFEDADVDTLAEGGERTNAAIARLYEVAMRVSGFRKDEVDEGKDADGSATTTG